MSLCFILSVSVKLKEHFDATCKEMLSWNQDNSQILEVVNNWLPRGTTDRVSMNLIKALLLTEIHDWKSASDWAKKARYDSLSMAISPRSHWAREIFIDTHLNFGAALTREGCRCEAEATVKKVISLFPNTPAAWCQLGRLHEIQKQFADAEIAFKRALKEHPWNAEAVHGLTNVYIEQDLLEKAENILRFAVEHHPNDGPLLNSIGVIQLSQGKICDAISKFERAISLDPEVFLLWNNLGASLEKNDQWIAAQKAYDRACLLDPWNWLPSTNLINLYVKSNSLPQAAKELHRCLNCQLQRADVAPLHVARQFALISQGGQLARYELVAQSDSAHKPPGSGEHIIDRYLLTVHKIMLEALEIGELSLIQVIDNLFAIAIILTSYAGQLTARGHSRRFVMERFYSIEQTMENWISQGVEIPDFTFKMAGVESKGAYNLRRRVRPRNAKTGTGMVSQRRKRAKTRQGR